MLAAPHIYFDRLRIGFGEKILIDELSGTLPAGKISVILGGSGSGKSTLLRHILGLHDPLSGSIRIFDKDICAMDRADFTHMRKRMGVLFQDGALLGSLNLAENIALPLLEHSDLDEAIIEEVVRMKLRLVGLEHAIYYHPRQLSGGMRKRAGLARAMVMDPDILLFDEPSAGLDPITAADLDQLILELKATFGMTIVVVTHDLDSLFTIADHVVVLYGGSVGYQGDLAGLARLEDVYIQRFLNREPDVVRDDIGQQLAVKTRDHNWRSPRERDTLAT